MGITGLVADGKKLFLWQEVSWMGSMLYLSILNAIIVVLSCKMFTFFRTFPRMKCAIVIKFN